MGISATNCSIWLNGRPREIAADATIADLLADLNLPAPLVAVEVNARLVPREQHAEHQLATGDRIEIVTLVGGG